MDLGVLVLSITLALSYLITLGNATKNVLFFASDDLRPELSSYLGPNFPSPVHPPIHSPNIDTLAAKSLLLKRAYCQQAVCSPSRTSLLTGRRPDTTHVYDLGTYFRDVGGNFTTLPQYFKQNGYTTVGMGKIFHPGRASNNDDPISWSEPYFHAPNLMAWNTRESWKAVPESEWKEKPLPDAQIADHAIETLQRLAPAAKGSKQIPFFVAVGFHKPHLPFVFPDSMFEHYPKESIKLPDNPYAPVDMPAVAWLKYDELLRYEDIRTLNVTADINTTLPDDVVLNLRRAYYSAVSWTDLQVGRVLDELEKLGLANNTIVSFWGDHGWQLGEHGEWTKQTNFELGTHAPMMIHVPGLTDKGISTTELTEYVDLFPTLVEAAGLEQLPICPKNSSGIALCREGTSLMPLIETPTEPIKKASFSQFPRPSMFQIEEMGYTMRTDRYRYTEWPKFIGSPDYKPDWLTLAGVELYDHQTDPEENINLANNPKYQTLRAQLSQQLRAGWREAQRV
ncbi:hypothetical protein FSP39_017975 [Pinctada imbricata]|uniref:Sulfatase N-terminal domain-containing protein n=1 Tax=Pinctada imbricata TaxID=66713 RepID=A0AA88YF83_PINIB|nr:hypothetical protein FSP39_017975 [Pinctada imbricata]